MFRPDGNAPKKAEAGPYTGENLEQRMWEQKFETEAQTLKQELQGITNADIDAALTAISEKYKEDGLSDTDRQKLDTQSKMIETLRQLQDTEDMGAALAKAATESVYNIQDGLKGAVGTDSPLYKPLLTLFETVINLSRARYPEQYQQQTDKVLEDQNTDQAAAA